MASNTSKCSPFFMADPSDMSDMSEEDDASSDSATYDSATYDNAINDNATSDSATSQWSLPPENMDALVCKFQALTLTGEQNERI